jgi:hypothetical protein
MRHFLWNCYDRLTFWFGQVGDFSRLTVQPNEVEYVAIAIERRTDCITHAGIVYRDNSDVLKLLHYGLHNYPILQEPCARRYVFAIPRISNNSRINRDKLVAIADFCARINRANAGGRMPYSFQFDPDINFDFRTGALNTTTHAKGLTCSTFVVAVFRSSLNDLVREITWPRQADAEDIESRKAVLEMWRKSGRPELIARAQEIEPTIETMRIRPEQVAGACLQNRLPVGFRRATLNGERVKVVFNQHFGMPSP